MKRSPIRKVSAKRAAENRKRAKLLLEIIGLPCEARLSVCTGTAQDGHEALMRSRGGDPTDRDQVTPICNACHRWVHDHPEEAERRGLMIHSWAALGRDTKEESHLAGGMFEDFLTGYIGEDVED